MFSIGIVGLPNVGKSTLFAALTKQQVNISNYPFCTIDPNVGCLAIPDARLDRLSKIIRPKRTFSAAIEFVDIAGLVSGAHKGEGLGNQFLAHIREVNAIVHILRLFKDVNITHVTGEIKPLHDLEVVNIELILADLQSLENQLKKIKNKGKSRDENILREISLFEKIKKSLENNIPIRDIKLDRNELAKISKFNFLTAKPVLYLLNINEDQIGKIPFFPIKPQLAIPLKLELELEDLDPKEKEEYLSNLGMEESGISRLIKECVRLLNLITFYTITGGQEIRAYVLAKGSNILEAAEQVHSDFKEKFIKAEVISYTDFLTACSETKAGELGLVKTCGKDYKVCDGDIIKFKI